MTEDYSRVIRDCDVFVVESGDELVAALVLADDEEGFTVENVAVHPTRQGEGVGRALLRLAESEARRAGRNTIRLYTHEKMTENQALYSGIGYAEYERRREGDFSRVFMRKKLG